MEMIRVGIYLDDKNFAVSMAKALAKESRRMTFEILKSPDDGCDCDVVLSSKYSDHIRFVSLVKEKVILSSDPPYELWQYAESRQMINDLLFIYFRMTGEVPPTERTGGCKLIAAVSTAGGSGTTTTAIAVSRMLYRIYGSRSLYLNLCHLNDSGKYLGGCGRNDLLRLLYYLDGERDFPLAPFITKTEELDFVGSGEINQCADDITPALMDRLLDKVGDQGEYEYVFVDMGSNLNRQNRKLLSKFNRIMLVSGKRPACRKDFDNRIADEVTKLAVDCPIIRIENFAEDGWQDRTDEAQRLYIGEEKEAIRGGENVEMEIDLNHSYGMDIAAIAKRITEEIDGNG